MSFPTGASVPTAEAIREWFRRTYGREPMEGEVEALQHDLTRRDPEPKSAEKDK